MLSTGDKLLIIRFLLLAARGLKAASPTGVAAPPQGSELLFQRSGPESASLRHSVPVVVTKNCLSLVGRGIQTLCSSFSAKDKENVNNLKLAAF